MATKGFWSQANIEPKRGYRWVAYIGGIEEWTVKKFSKPSVSITESPLKFLNHTFYYPGRAEWSETSFTLVDPANPDSAAIMMGKLQRSGYATPDSIENAYSTISKDKAVRLGMGNVVIKQLGAEAESESNPNVIETWTFWNPWVKDLKFGELDYESDDMVNIEVTLRYDYAVWAPGPNGQSPEQWAATTDGQNPP